MDLSAAVYGMETFKTSVLEYLESVVDVANIICRTLLRTEQ